MARTVTIVHPGALGDVLLSLPAIRALRASFPRQEFGLLAGDEVGKLLRACGEIERLFPLEGDSLASLLADRTSRSRGWAGQTFFEWLSRCDLAVCWMADPDGRLAGSLGDLGVDRIIVGSPLSADCQGAHQADRLMETLRGVVTTCRHEEKLKLPDKVLDAARARLEALGDWGKQPLAVIHPGSGSPHKCSEPALLAQAVTWLQANGAAPVLVGGPADDERLAEVSSRCAVPPPACRGLDLLSVAGLLAHGRLFLGHDSGLTHLAASLHPVPQEAPSVKPWYGLHIQTVALFGPTDCSRWAPRGPHVTVLSGAPCLCREQGRQTVQQCRDKPCLQIPAERLVLACQQGLQGAGGWCREQPTSGSAPCYAQ
ncbi:MAG: glycosyltransferase family 9 protein [Nitrospirae bacterium]|nr:glycosyltransferase family 9 protein [Nitrospirota bacterium]